MSKREANRSARNHRRHRAIVAPNQLDTLGRSKVNKRGPKAPKCHTTEERDALDTFGKYARLDGQIVETLQFLHRVDELVKL